MLIIIILTDFKQYFLLFVIFLKKIQHLLARMNFVLF